MSMNYDEIKQQIEPLRNKVFYFALTEEEILNIEIKISNKFPKYFRDFLKIFGVRQDFVFELLKKEDDFVQKTEYLPKSLRDSFVVIGDNGGEDFWLLNSKNENDTKVYEWQYWLEGEIVEKGFEFKSLLQSSINKLFEQ